MKRMGILMLVFFFCLSLTAWPQAQAQWAPKIITVDAPGAGTGPGQGTEAPGINWSGEVAGFYADTNNVVHSFLRTPEGRYITFDAPGAGNQNVAGFQPTPAGYFGQGTYAIAVNDEGSIAGFYYDENDVGHGFLRTPEGKFKIFDYWQAGTGAGQGTFGANISPTGEIAGYYVDAGNVTHGLLRTPNGKLIPFDAPQAGTGAGQGTFPEWASCINPAGAVTGFYADASNVAHGFLRTADGIITEFDVQGAGASAGQGTYSWSIDAAGSVTADYVDVDNVDHGYVRAPDSHITRFDISGAGTAEYQGTVPEGISAGVVIGNYIDASGLNHAFVRSPWGKITEFNIKGAGTGSGQGVIPLTNNQAGAITGVYFDSGNVIHSFLLIP